jgi:hypothetical protein
MIAGSVHTTLTGQSGRHQALSATPSAASRGARRSVVAQSHKKERLPYRGERGCQPSTGVDPPVAVGRGIWEAISCRIKLS